MQRRNIEGITYLNETNLYAQQGRPKKELPEKLTVHIESYPSILMVNLVEGKCVSEQFLQATGISAALTGLNTIQEFVRDLQLAYCSWGQSFKSHHTQTFLGHRLELWDFLC
ncbi:hypothetical protein CHARACLAT_032610 [Characodon lateralis]|uniref:Uncharacterized protein n=1 Tax=Characodon lateralis TaxID=208331 RepID=A0ABU7DC96_9TELE|nr:hypothetical protein [Characodon lateralis]